MAAVTSGGEARPNFPDFNKVMMITGEIKEPKRIMPVYGFNGQELWPSDVGVKLGCQEDITAEGWLRELLYQQSLTGWKTTSNMSKVGGT